MILLDTHVMIWAACAPERMRPETREMLTTPAQVLHYSVASTWELAIKFGRQGGGERIDPAELLRGLLAHGYREIEVTNRHALEVTRLPPVHKDPFDRLLIAQARVEGLTFLTADARLAAYGFPVRVV